MSKASNVALAALVFFLVLLPSVAMLSGSNSPSYGWVIGLVFALAIGAGSYFLFDRLLRRADARQDETARQLFAPVLPPGETLLGFVQGYTGPGHAGMVLLFGAVGDAIVNSPRRRWYYVGLTRQYLILLQVNGRRPTGVQQVLRRSEVRQLGFESGAFKEPKVILQFPAETMELRLEANMTSRAKEMDAIWRSAAPGYPG